MQSEVIRNKDASSLPKGLIAMVTLQCSAWTVYGFLQDDASTFINNVVGVVLGTAQLLLIYSCPNKRAAAGAAAVKYTKVATSEDSSTATSVSIGDKSSGATSPSADYQEDRGSSRSVEGSSGAAASALSSSGGGLVSRTPGSRSGSASPSGSEGTP